MLKTILSMTWLNYQTEGFTSKITELTGITDAMLESGIDQYQLFDKIYRAFTTPSRS